MALRHLSRLSIARLSLDLLASPSRSLNCAALKISIALCLFDECCNPFGSVKIGIFAVGEGIGEVT